MESRPVLMVLATLAGCGAIACAANAPLDVGSCAAALAATLPPQVAATIPRIDGQDRQLLALRSYLRSAESLGSKWSWSEEQIAAYARTAEYQAAQAELARINVRFEAANPGYTLYVNSQVRSVDRQIRLWNGNTSVRSRLRRRCRRQSGHGNRARLRPERRCGKADARGFPARLVPPRPAPLAAPGLSKHGQARAFDFQIKRGNRTRRGYRHSHHEDLGSARGGPKSCARR